MIKDRGKEKKDVRKRIEDARRKGERGWDERYEEVEGDKGRGVRESYCGELHVPFFQINFFLPSFARLLRF